LIITEELRTTKGSAIRPVGPSARGGVTKKIGTGGRIISFGPRGPKRGGGAGRKTGRAMACGGGVDN